MPTTNFLRPVVLSIVVPALNESAVIGRQIRCVRSLTRHIPTEIVVVDNGSTDGTPDIAISAGADVVRSVSGSIGAARNAGVKASSGTVLVFLDADVFPTEIWAQKILVIVHDVLTSRLLTGSKVGIPVDATWIERCWFAPSVTMPASYINSGHMILSRSLFDELGGFNEHLKTGEDYELSQRALAAGVTVHADLSLPVIHEGFPKTVWQFLKREVWHGMGDSQSRVQFFRSKVALAGVGTLHAIVVGLALSVLSKNPWWLFASLTIVIFLAYFAFARKSPRASIKAKTYGTLLFVIYFVARGLSPYVSIVTNRFSGHRR